MKQLIKLILIAFLCSFYTINTSAQRMQWLTDDLVIDTRGAMAKGSYSLHPFFDRYGMWYYHDADPADNVEIGKTSDNKKIIVQIEPKQSGAFDWSQYFAYINQWMLRGFEGENRETPYGITRYIHYLPPGEHIINAWQTNYLHYSGIQNYNPGINNWTIAKQNQSCECSYTKNQGDFVELTFSGRGVEVISEKLPTHGTVQIEVDYKDYGIVNTFSNDTTKNLSIFKVSNLDSKQHTIRLTKVENDGYFVLKQLIVTNEREDIPQPIIRDTIYIDYPEERPYYDTLLINPDTVNTVLISKHNEIKEAYEKAIKSILEEGKTFNSIDRVGRIELRKDSKGYYLILKERIY